MIFSKLLPRKISFVVVLIAGLSFIGLAVVNLGMPISDIFKQLAAIALMVALLIVSAMAAALTIRWLAKRVEAIRKVNERENDLD